MLLTFVIKCGHFYSNYKYINTYNNANINYMHTHTVKMLRYISMRMRHIGSHCFHTSIYQSMITCGIIQAIIDSFMFKVANIFYYWSNKLCTTIRFPYHLPDHEYRSEPTGYNYHELFIVGRVKCIACIVILLTQTCNS